MASDLRILILECYPRQAREHLLAHGASTNHQLYLDVLRRALPGATLDVLCVGDPDDELPGGASLASYHGVIWTGSNLTIYEDLPVVRRQIELARRVYALGQPQFGSCWGLQMAAVAAGGLVERNPAGRELLFGRRIHLTPAGQGHPMLCGKPAVYDGFIMHLDHVTRLPPGGVVLASNAHTPVQALCVRHGPGEFWATQYHPEYTLRAIAKLLLARGEKLVVEGWFEDLAAVRRHHDLLVALDEQRDRHDLRWLSALDDSLLAPALSELELHNWLSYCLLPWRQRLGS